MTDEVKFKMAASPSYQKVCFTQLLNRKGILDIISNKFRVAGYFGVILDSVLV